MILSFLYFAISIYYLNRHERSVIDYYKKLITTVFFEQTRCNYFKKISRKLSL